MKIEKFEVTSKKDKVYLELMEQYKTNHKVKKFLDKTIVPSSMVLSGDFRLITMINYAIDKDDILVYLEKDIDNDIFLSVIGNFIDEEYFLIYPLLN